MATAFEDIKFPVYRKYKNSKSYFKIIHPLLFEEIQIIGTKKALRRTEVRQFPEKNFVNDLICNFAQMADEITEAEYEAVRSDLKI